MNQSVTLFFFFIIGTGLSSEDDAHTPKVRKKTYMNQPHLRFEITSDDGFSVKANSIEGETFFEPSVSTVSLTCF